MSTLMRCCVVVAVLVGAPSVRGAFVVDDPSYFAGKDHVFLDFETRGDGSPVGLGFKEARLLTEDEYAALGVRFPSDPAQWAWAHIGTPPDPNASRALAVEAVGSWPTVIGGIGDTARIVFTAPVRSFGIGVVQQGIPGDGEPAPEVMTTITAFNADGDELGVVRLWDSLIDGGTGGVHAGGIYGEEWRLFTYGFLGLATDEPIAMLEFTNARDTIFDHLHFSAIPAPGAGAAMGLLGLGALVRRRR